MHDNKAFAAWALFIVAGAGLVFATLVLTGIATLPPLTTFLTDVAMGLGIRAAYKQVGGWEWAEWSWAFAGDSPEAVAAVMPLAAAREGVSKAA